MLFRADADAFYASAFSRSLTERTEGGADLCQVSLDPVLPRPRSALSLSPYAFRPFLLP